MWDTTGITDIKFRQASPRNALRPDIVLGEERYQGSFDIAETFNMSVVGYSREFRLLNIYADSSGDDEWLSCCVCGYSSMDNEDKVGP